MQARVDKTRGIAEGGLILAFAATLSLLCICSAVDYRDVRIVRDNELRVSETNQALKAALLTATSVNGVESSARGFVLTGRPEFRDEYLLRRADLLLGLNNLRQVTGNDATARPVVAQLGEVLTQRLTTFQKAVQRRVKAGPISLPQVNSPSPIVLAQRKLANGLLAKLTRAKETQLNAEQASANQALDAATQTYWITSVIGVLAILGFFGATVRLLQAQKRIRVSEARRTAELEDLVQARMSDLIQANADLEAFSYSVSHDLRTPLRAISGYAAILRAELGKGLPSDQAAHLDRISSSCQNMAALIDDLLDLSRVTRSPINLTQVDLSTEARKVASDLQSGSATHLVTFDIQPDVRCTADGALMRILLVNLIGNAYKFTNGVASPKVRFGTTDNSGEHAFFVEDNGVGFDASAATTLFQPFTRFHSEREFSGTGIGLSICSRIIRRHGGRIWIESAKGAGTRVFFTLMPTRAVTMSMVETPVAVSVS